MSTTTPNFELIKPELTDPADITAINQNWDKIDEELKKGEALVVTATIMPSSVTLDKTFDEIYTAWSNGTKVYMSVSDGRYILTPNSVSSSSINFTTVYSYNGKLTLWVVGVFSNNTADQITYIFPTMDELEAATNVNTVDVTLTASGWSNGVQNVTVSGVTADSCGDVYIAPNATLAQFNAFNNGFFHLTAQATNSITLTCRGTVPTIDIPIQVEVRG